MTDLLDMERETAVPDGLVAAVRRVSYRAQKYRDACKLVEHFEADFRQFRTLQCLSRMSNAEASANRARESLDEAIDQMRAFVTNHSTNGD